MQVRCTTSSPVLLLLDNHDSHLSIEVLDYAKDHGIVMLSFPPHCSHHMQPLDRTVYGPFKKHYNSALREWMVDNPGKPAGIYNIPALVAKAFPKAMTVENITSGFRVTGIFPHNANVFPEEAFLPAQVTDRPQPDDQVLTAATVDPPTTAASASVSAPDSSDVDKQPGQQAASSLESEQPQTVTSCDVPVSSPPTDATNPPTTADSASAEPFAVTFGPRSFASSAPTLWNSLPLPLRDSTLTPRHFGSRLKTHLFSLAYGRAS